MTAEQRYDECFEEHGLSLIDYRMIEAEWDKALAIPQNKLERMAAEALKAYRAGETGILGLSKL